MPHALRILRNNETETINTSRVLALTHCGTARQKKRKHFSFMNKSFNTQCNLTKFSTLIANEYCHRCYLLISGIYANFADYCAKSVT